MYEIIYILRVKFKQHLDVDKSIAEFVRSVSEMKKRNNITK